MGLLDTIVGQVAGAMSESSGNANPVLTEVLGGLLGGNSGSGAGGGLGALIAAFDKNGLGNLVASWIGTGQNLPISGEQLQSVLGSDKLQAIAQQLGLSSTDASNMLSSVLPQFIDQLTPNGQLPDNQLLEQGLSMLKKFGASA